MAKIVLSDELQCEMAQYRMGAAPIPHGYVEVHRVAANNDLLKRTDWKILEDDGLVDDGHMDGMRVRQVTVAIKTDGQWEVSKLRWHDSCNAPAWFKDTGYGYTRAYEAL